MNTLSLGDTARDTISGFQGIVHGRHSFMSGTTCFSLAPTKLDDKGLPGDPAMIDWQQLELVTPGPGEKPSDMPVFNFGDQVECMVTDFAGIVTSKHEYLNGCVNYGIQPRKLTRDGDIAKTRTLNSQAMILKGRLADPLKIPESGGPEMMPV